MKRKCLTGLVLGLLVFVCLTGCQQEANKELNSENVIHDNVPETNTEDGIYSLVDLYNTTEETSEGVEQSLTGPIVEADFVLSRHYLVDYSSIYPNLSETDLCQDDFPMNAGAYYCNYLEYMDNCIYTGDTLNPWNILCNDEYTTIRNISIGSTSEEVLTAYDAEEAVITDISDSRFSTTDHIASRQITFSYSYSGKESATINDAYLIFTIDQNDTVMMITYSNSNTL